MKSSFSFLRRLLFSASVFVVSFIPLMAARADAPWSQTPSAGQSSYSFSATTVAPNEDFTFTATIRNAAGNPLVGKLVQISTSLGGMSTVPGGAFTNELGQAVYTIRFSQTGTATLSVSVDGVTIDPAQTVIEVKDNTVSANHSSISFSSTSVGVNQEIIFTADIRNAQSQPLAGKLIQVFSDKNIMTSDPAAALTNTSGVGTYKLRFSQTGQVVLTVKVDGVTIPPITTITIADSAVSVTNSSITFSSNSIGVNQDVTFTANVRNAQGQPLAGKLIQVFSDKNIMTSDPGAAYTNTSGVGTYKLRFSQSGPVVLTAKVDGMTISPVTTIQVTDPGISASQSTVSASPTTVATDPVYGSGVSVTVRNSSGQLMTGKWVSLQVSPSASVTVSPSNVMTNELGVANFVVKSSAAGTVSVTAYVEGIALNQQPNITFTGSGSACQFAGYELIKLPDDGNSNTQEDSAVYYYGKDCKRHAFPNVQTYMSWYWDFSKVQTVSAVTLSLMPLGKNVTYRPGVYMVKFPSVPKVYAVGRGGVLRWVTSESLATTMYGSSWRYLVYDIPESFYTNYVFGADIVAPGNFIPNTERDSTPTINDSL
ncbi:hypothetical protein FJZ48_02330 [Candidatus Uhrbacteria bacterium]|nr:hypothetical protein [Candidatus Uhrbacteria bacterium]